MPGPTHTLNSYQTHIHKLLVYPRAFGEWVYILYIECVYLQVSLSLSTHTTNINQITTNNNTCISANYVTFVLVFILVVLPIWVWVFSLVRNMASVTKKNIIIIIIGNSTCDEILFWVYKYSIFMHKHHDV